MGSARETALGTLSCLSSGKALVQLKLVVMLSRLFWPVITLKTTGEFISFQPSM